MHTDKKNMRKLNKNLHQQLEEEKKQKDNDLRSSYSPTDLVDDDDDDVPMPEPPIPFDDDDLRSDLNNDEDVDDDYIEPPLPPWEDEEDNLQPSDIISDDSNDEQSSSDTKHDDIENELEPPIDCRLDYDIADLNNEGDDSKEPSKFYTRNYTYRYHKDGVMVKKLDMYERDLWKFLEAHIVRGPSDDIHKVYERFYKKGKQATSIAISKLDEMTGSGISRSTIIRRLKSLENKGVIRIYSSKTKQKKNNCKPQNIYVLGYVNIKKAKKTIDGKWKLKYERYYIDEI
jgi:hypothetical protein